jgi:trk system potassium uptake protein TrkH
VGVSIFGGSFRTLHFAVRFRVLCKYTGQILLVLAALTVVPAAAALLGGRADVGLRYLGVIAAFVILGGAGARLRCTDRMQPNEAMVISALVFLIPGLAMAIPLSGYGLSPLDAVFESISGVTTTGLSTLGGVEGMERSFLFARAWFQWVGGLGVVVLALSFTIPSGVAAKRLGFDDREAADYVGGTRAHARRTLAAYAALTLAGFGLCALAGLGWFDALAHTLAAVSTGGFSTHDASLAALPWTGRLAVSALCLFGAIAFSLYYRGRFREAMGDSRLWTLLALAALGAVFLAVVESTAHPGTGTYGNAVWMAISAQTTAGFSTVAPADLSAGGRLALIVGMLIGGEVGSTAGGLKTLRLLILGQLLVLRILRMSTPSTAQIAPRLGGSRIDSDEIEAAAALALAYLGVVGVSWMAFVVKGHEPLDSLFDVVSAVGTVGLSSGVTGPGLEPSLKGVLCVDMLLGRVELFAFFVLVFPGTWLGRRRPSR